MTDWGCIIDYALLGSQSHSARKHYGKRGKFAYPDDAEETPDTLTTVYDFGKFNVLWEHATGINGGPYGRDHGIAFIGNNGTLVVDRGGWEVMPETQDGKAKMDAVSLQKDPTTVSICIPKIFSGWLSRVKWKILNAAFTKARMLPRFVKWVISPTKQEENLLGCCKEKFTDADANKFLTAEYHNGYTLPRFSFLWARQQQKFQLSLRRTLQRSD